MTTLSSSVWVALGSALGGVARYWFTTVTNQMVGADFPWSTIAINVLGSLVIGMVAARSPSDAVRLFVMVGICGGFTTFSAFSLQTFALLQEGQPFKALANVLLSVLVCLAATWAGWRLAS
jgi:fluoride exporter